MSRSPISLAAAHYSPFSVPELHVTMPQYARRGHSAAAARPPSFAARHRHTVTPVPAGAGRGRAGRRVRADRIRLAARAA
eukprot:139177-Hanusia_phi.AAC.1